MSCDYTKLLRLELPDREVGQILCATRPKRLIDKQRNLAGKDFGVEFPQSVVRMPWLLPGASGSRQSDPLMAYQG